MQVLFDRLISVVTFDVLEIFDEFDLQTLPEFTVTEPLNDNCDIVGYGSTNTVENLSSINYLIVIVLLRIFIFAAQQVLCCNRQPRLKKLMIDKESLMSGTLRFMLESFFDLFLAVILTFAPIKYGKGVFYLKAWTRADKASVIFLWFLVAVLTVFLLLTALATLCLHKPQKTPQLQLHNEIVHDILDQVYEDKKVQDIENKTGPESSKERKPVEETSDKTALKILKKV